MIDIPPFINKNSPSRRKMFINNKRRKRNEKRMENTISKLVRLMDMAESRKRIMINSLLSGIFRGLGLMLGTTVVLAILFKILEQIISMKIPYITEYLLDVADMMKAPAVTPPPPQ